MDLDDHHKRSVILHCGRRYKRGNQILLLFKFRELEKLTSLALAEKNSFFEYGRVADNPRYELKYLDSKSFRIINKIEAYLSKHQLQHYFLLHEEADLSRMKKSDRLLLSPLLFYKKLYDLGIRKSQRPIEALSVFLALSWYHKDFLIDMIDSLIKMQRQGNLYMKSFGTQRRKLP